MMKIAVQRLSLTLISAAGLLFSSAAGAQSVVLTGILADKALISVDGYAPVLLTKGQPYQGISLVSIDAERHAITVKLEGTPGQRELRLGASPSTIGGGSGSAVDVIKGSGKRISMAQAADGKFYAEAYVNEQRTRWMLDPEASSLAIGQDDANRLDISRLQRGDMATLRTPSGPYIGERVILGSLRIGEVELRNVEVIIVPSLPVPILGKSFLDRFKVQRNNDILLLERKL